MARGDPRLAAASLSPQSCQHVVGDLFNLPVRPSQSMGPVSRPRGDDGRSRLVGVSPEDRMAVTDAFNRFELPVFRTRVTRCTPTRSARLASGDEVLIRA